jgi:hypothetical protein
VDNWYGLWINRNSRWEKLKPGDVRPPIYGGRFSNMQTSIAWKKIFLIFRETFRNHPHKAVDNFYLA